MVHPAEMEHHYPSSSSSGSSGGLFHGQHPAVGGGGGGTVIGVGGSSPSSHHSSSSSSSTSFLRYDESQQNGSTDYTEFEDEDDYSENDDDSDELPDSDNTLLNGLHFRIADKRLQPNLCMYLIQLSQVKFLFPSPLPRLFFFSLLFRSKPPPKPPNQSP